MKMILRDSLERASEGRTTIIIAHRLSTIQWVDRIFVMKEGEIVNIGNHQTLLQESEVYKNLMKHQVAYI